MHAAGILLTRVMLRFKLFVRSIVTVMFRFGCTSAVRKGKPVGAVRRVGGMTPLMTWLHAARHSASSSSSTTTQQEHSEFTWLQSPPPPPPIEAPRRNAMATSMAQVEYLVKPFLSDLFSHCSVVQRNPLDTSSTSYSSCASQQQVMSASSLLRKLPLKVLKQMDSASIAALVARTTTSVNQQPPAALQTRKMIGSPPPVPPWMLDAVLLVGGYETNDFRQIILNRIAGIIPHHQLDQRENSYINTRPKRKRKSKSLISLDMFELQLAMDEDRFSPTTKMLRDCFQLGIEEAPPESEMPGTIHTFFVGIGNPECTAASLNRLGHESERLLVRPNFGFSRELLMRSLPRSVPLAASTLHSFASHNIRPEMCPPEMFWISLAYRTCLAQHYHNTNSNTHSGVKLLLPVSGSRTHDQGRFGCGCSGGEGERAIALANEVLQELWDASKTPEHPRNDDIYTNYFLPIERFDTIATVKAFRMRLEVVMAQTNGRMKPPVLEHSTADCPSEGLLM